METGTMVPTAPQSSQSWIKRNEKLARWAAVLLSGAIVAAMPVPSGITRAGWNLLAIFVATIVGSVVTPIPAAAIVLMAITLVALVGALPLTEALAGWSDPVVWIVLPAFFIARAMLQTGLGRRIAFWFIRALGKHSLGLGYSLACTDLFLGGVIPANSARCGGVIFPIARSLAGAYESAPGASARRLGAYLMVLIYQVDVVVAAMYLTGQASNPLAQRFAAQTANVEVTYAGWLAGSIVPGLTSLILVPLLLYKLFPPEIKRTPAAAAYARQELEQMGPMSWAEKILLMVFFMVAGLWIWNGIHYSVVALLGLCVLLLTGVLKWGDLLEERTAWDIFVWYGGLVCMGNALGETGLTKRFADAAAGFTMGWTWGAAMAGLLLIYFFAHYGFASITAHVTAMYIPFLVVLLAAGAPTYLAVLSLAYFSNLAAGLTHYGTTPAPIIFGAGYVTQVTWWKLGLTLAVLNIAIWTGVGFAWWKVLGLW
jgi:DASS family divalent anion:Na+ symporter